jgi:methyl-accepting chemotaxis protein/DNA-binding LacI/PurR family transcriptional regulator
MILAGFFIQFLLLSLFFIFANHDIENQYLVIMRTIGFVLLITSPLGILFSSSTRKLKEKIRTLESARMGLEESIAMQKEDVNSELLRLAERVSSIANSLGYTSGYMDTLTYQTEERAGEITAAFRQVVTGSGQESESIHQISTQMDMMASSISGIAKGAQDQARSVENAVTTTSRVNQAILEISEKANIAADTSAEAAKAASVGAETIKETIQSINKIRDRVDEAAMKVQEMDNRSEEIGTIVEKLKDIASQTDLLALNAAIEAARAGELGQGFSVVASEVRKLAEKSVLASKEVGILVGAIQISAKEAVASMKSGVEEVKNGVEWVKQSGDVFSNIENTTEIANRNARGVVGLTEQQLSQSQALGLAMENVSAIVEENAASTQEMAASADNISKEMENIARASAINNATAQGVEALTKDIFSLATDETASAQTLAEMASSLQNVVAPYHKISIPHKVLPQKILNVRPTIGIILPTTSNQFWDTAVKFARLGAEELGVNLLVCDSQDNPEIMEKHLREVTNGKVDGFLWVPYWGLGRKGLELASQSNTPVLLVDSYQKGLQPQSEEFPDYLAFVGPADETGAYEMGKFLCEKIPLNQNGKKVIAALDGLEGAATAILRHKGLVRAMKEHPEAVLATSQTADYDFEKARAATSRILKEFPDVTGIWSANDLMVQGGIAAAKDAGRSPGMDLFFVGMDLDQNSIKAIREGLQLFDIGGHWLQLGFGLTILFDHLNGYTIPKGRAIVKLPLLPVVKDKLDQFEKDYPNGLPKYEFRQYSRAHNPEAPITFFEMKYSS